LIIGEKIFALLLVPKITRISESEGEKILLPNLKVRIDTVTSGGL